MEKNQYQKKKEADGYVVVEAVVLLPLASIFIVLLIGLCSYLYQGCFLMQAAYTVAFRSAGTGTPGRRLCGWAVKSAVGGGDSVFWKRRKADQSRNASG